MKEAMKEDVKDFAKVYGAMVGAMLAFAGAAAVDGNDTGVGVCVGLAAIAAIMYAGTIILAVVVELVNFLKGKRK